LSLPYDLTDPLELQPVALSVDHGFKNTTEGSHKAIAGRFRTRTPA
jgi:hypothetical protein